MAVPKKKTSKSRRNMRRSHLALKTINVIVDKDTGEYRLPHQMSSKDGTYNGRQIVTQKIINDDEDLD
jgi:large subunit ribosomal protein L32